MGIEAIFPWASHPYTYPVPSSLYARMATCYPWRGGVGNNACRDTLNDLASCGVTSLISAGRIVMSWGRLLGKGHASLVAAGIYRGKVVAVKIRRTDSKHESFTREARIHEVAWKAGVAPRLHCYRDNVIVMDIVTGIPLGSLWEVGRGTVSLVLSSAYSLDRIGVYHHELTRPWKHVLLTDANAVIIDYGSSSMEYCRNLPSIIGSLLAKKGVRIEGRLKEMLAAYKKGCDRDLYSSIRRLALSYFR